MDGIQHQEKSTDMLQDEVTSRLFPLPVDLLNDNDDDDLIWQLLDDTNNNNTTIMNGATACNIYFTVHAKLEAIAAVKKGERRMKVAHSLGITGAVLSEWLAALAHQDWLMGCQKSPINHESDTLDRAVYTWYIQQLKADIHPTFEEVIKKADVFATRLNKAPGHVNAHWVNVWMFRHSIRLRDANAPKVSAAQIMEEEIEDKKIKEQLGNESDLKALAGNGLDPKPKQRTRKRASTDKNASGPEKIRTYARNNNNKMVNGYTPNDHKQQEQPVSKRFRSSSSDSQKENIKVAVDSKPALEIKPDNTEPKDETEIIVNFKLEFAIDALIRKIKPDPTPNMEMYEGLSNRLGTCEVQCKFVETLLRRSGKFSTLYKNSGLYAQRQARLNADCRKRPTLLKGKGSNQRQMDDSDDGGRIEFPATKNEIIFSGQNKLERRHLPPFGSVKRPELKTGMLVYAAKTTSLSTWMLARILEIKMTTTDGLTQPIYRVRFENKKNPIIRVCPAKLLAYSEPPNVTLPVGSRIVARYKEDTGEYHIALYAGIIAEPPKVTNNLRYLVFFDDGYAQYVRHFEVFLVCSGKKEVWEEIMDRSRDFIRTYLAQYPERPMVKLQRGQRVNTEFNGRWWSAIVNRVDSSLVEMYFESDRRTEWIYRGSTRLEPLFQELARTKAIKESGKPVKRHNTSFKRKDRPYVEYTCFNDDDMENGRAGSPEIEVLDPANDRSTPQQAARKQMARKSTTQDVNHLTNGNGLTSNGLFVNYKHPGVIDPAKAISQLGTTETFTLTNPKRISYLPHRCVNHCLGKEDPLIHRGQNPLRIPMLCGWQREVIKFSVGCKREIFYRAPCGRRFRNMEEVARFLRTTNSKLTIDLFCYDVAVHTFVQFKPLKTCYYTKDITFGQEPVPVCCVNSLSNEKPPYLEYSAKRFTAKGVSLTLDPEFLCGCDCVDDCQNREKCQCQQLTVTASGVLSAEPRKDAGYKNRRLMEPLMTGIYECNSRCKCKSSCVNRVAQNGLQVRLQMFKTEQRGWGIRCLDDIPQGMFICIYAGQLLSEQEAIDQGKSFGDEYQAELDHIEVVECYKEGYEADVVEPGISQDLTYKPPEQSDNSSDSDSDTEFRPTYLGGTTSNGGDGSTDNLSKMSTRNKRSSSNSNESETVVGAYAALLADSDSNSNSNIGGDKEERATKLSSSFVLDKVVSQPESTTKAVEQRKPMRMTYFNEEFCYIMDAKTKGNIGRYLNHSCSPNVFVQNVFVDTHDLRFPWVAFFASTFIRSGKELTWDYNYEIGSVQGKVMYCFCGTPECRGRLL